MCKKGGNINRYICHICTYVYKYIFAFLMEVKTKIKILKQMNLTVYQVGDITTQRKKTYVTLKHSVSIVNIE